MNYARALLAGIKRLHFYKLESFLDEYLIRYTDTRTRGDCYLCSWRRPENHNIRGIGYHGSEEFRSIRGLYERIL